MPTPWRGSWRSQTANRRNRPPNGGERSRPTRGIRRSRVGEPPGIDAVSRTGSSGARAVGYPEHESRDAGVMRSFDQRCLAGEA